jgi:predicted transcriptional regulator
MSDTTQQLQPASASSLATNLRNPLVIFGLILLAGDGPLVIAYALTQDQARAWVLLVAVIVFIFGMGAFFCYLVAFKPRNLYSPSEIPEKAFGKSIYQDPEPVKRILKDAQAKAADLNSVQTDNERRTLSENLNYSLTTALQLQAAYDMLLIPGYDLSLISDILESFDRTGTIEPEPIARLRNITPSTIVTIVNSMNVRGYLQPKGKGLALTDKGEELLNNLRRHLRPIASN